MSREERQASPLVAIRDLAVESAVREDAGALMKHVDLSTLIDFAYLDEASAQ